MIDLNLIDAEMIAANLPALQVVLPLLAAPIALLLGRGLLAWFWALLVSWIGLGISIALLVQVMETGPIHYAFGGWPPPWGIEYVIDRLAVLVLLVVSLIGALVLSFARRSVASELDPDKRGILYALMLLCLGGLLGMVTTGDAFNLFVLLEISSLSTYALISLGRDRRALTASYQYLVMGTIGATFFIIGVGLLYMVTGTLNMADLAVRIEPLEDMRTVKTALGFITVGLALKLAMFPLHLWLPNAYAYAPSVVSAFLAATATKVALYAMIRFIYTVFGADFVFSVAHVAWLLLPLAILAIFVASVVAVFQQDLKRMLAYSSIAQIGYMLLGLAMVNLTGLTASLLHLFNHALMKGALFLALGAVVYRIGNANIDRLAGLAREMPLTMAAFVVGGLSLIGVPLTAGFISKWYLILGAMENGWWPVVVLLLISSLIAVIYVWQVVEKAYFQPRPADAPAVEEAPWSLLAPIWALALANLYFGIHPGALIGWVEGAAAGLLGGGG